MESRINYEIEGKPTLREPRKRTTSKIGSARFTSTGTVVPIVLSECSEIKIQIQGEFSVIQINETFSPGGEKTPVLSRISSSAYFVSPEGVHYFSQNQELVLHVGDPKATQVLLHLKLISAGLEDLPKHLASELKKVSNLQDQISSLASIIEDKERHINNLDAILGGLKAQLAEYARNAWLQFSMKVFLHLPNRASDAVKRLRQRVKGFLSKKFPVRARVYRLGRIKKELFPRGEELQEHFFYSVDSINGVDIGSSRTVAVEAKDDGLWVRGWAFFQQRDKAPFAVWCQVDGVWYQGNAGMARSDLMRHFETPGAEGLGFEIQIPPNLRKPAPTRVEQVAVYLDDTHYALVKTVPISISYVPSQYSIWIENTEPNATTLARQKEHKFRQSPLVSIVVPTYNTPPRILREMIESVQRQTYSRWELCIADASAPRSPARAILERARLSDPRVKVKYLEKNHHIAGNTNAAIALSTGEYVGFLDHDDTLAPFALFEVIKKVNDHPDVEFFYSDEDKLTTDGKSRKAPFFKPDYSPETILSYNYICHWVVVQRSLGQKIGWLRDGFDGAQDYDFILRASEHTTKICHIPQVLYHWRLTPESTALNPNSKLYAYTAAKKALKEHISRRGIPGEVIDSPYFGTYQVHYALEEEPLVSIVIPTHNELATLQRCIESIVKQTTYPRFEILLLENGSTDEAVFTYYKQLEKDARIRVLTWKEKKFNYSGINNWGAKHAQGDYLVFLNNDVEVITPSWIERMLEHAQRDQVGAVGAKLLYPDDTIQHAGIIVGIGGVAGHPHKGVKSDLLNTGYYNRLAIVQDLSAVTAACLMVRTDRFKEVQGFDEAFVLAFNDVDFCLRMRSRGLSVIWTPFAELYHYESKTRGYEDTPEKVARFEKETKLFLSRWREILAQGDPFYNVNLTRKKEDFSLAL